MTPRPSSDAILPLDPAAREFLPQERFYRFFQTHDPLPPTGLLDSESSRCWFDILAWAYKNDFYTLQPALESKSGPRVQVNDREFRMVSSYDYLGLIGDTRLEEAAVAAIAKYGTGTGGVRLLTGTSDLHAQFEAELAAFKGTEASITFSSGYMANLAVLSALLGPGDKAVLDSRAHRSIYDACRLARVPVCTFAHNDTGALRKILEEEPAVGRTLIVVDGIYSMDGDICPLPELIDLKRKHGAYLMVDEAHSFGVLGVTGRGVDQHFGLEGREVDIWMGSLSKALPSNGGFIAGTQALIIYLQHAAAPFMFSAALCPSAIAAGREALKVVQDEPHRLIRLHRNADFLRAQLTELGYDTGASVSPVIPVITGSDEAACRLARELLTAGILAIPVLYPAVPRGKARLRLCATAAQDEVFLGEVVDGFRAVRSKVPLSGSLPRP
jgi:8-amino-7-oxononanoate synthase